MSSKDTHDLYAIRDAGDVYVTDGATIKATGTGENFSGNDKTVAVYGVYVDSFNNTINVASNGTEQGTVNIIAQATGDTATTTYHDANANANAYGLYLKDLSENTINGNVTIEATATGGTATGAYANAYGLYTDASPNTINGNVIVEAKATGGTATTTYYGANANANAYGLCTDGGQNTINGNVTIEAKATGGTATGTDGGARAYAEAYGLCTPSGQNTINGNITIEVTATGGIATATGAGTVAEAYAYAYGLFAYNESQNIVTGDAIIKTDATVQQSGQEFRASSLYAMGSNAVNNLSSLGTIRQLEGDVYAKVYGTNKLVMDTAASYLQGNLLQGPYSNGTNNITISKGATWRPVYDNRYGSYFDKNKADTYVKTYAVDDIVTTGDDVITLSDGGIIDLTWDSPLASRSSNFRTLTLENLKGTNGIFRINTDLANNKADKITLNAADSGSTVKIQVNYDPYFATNPNVGESITGAAGVLKGTAASTITVTGAESEYNAYKFTPTIAWNSNSKQWELTTLTNGEPTPTPTVTTSVMTVADSRMVMNEMWQADTNSLNKRLGELRSTKPEGGIWARYGHGKLENGNGRTAELKYNLFQVGYDKSSTTDSGSNVYRGLAVTHTKGDSSYETGSGEAKYTNLALYQTWLGKGGDYYDVILKYGRLSNDYNVVDLSSNYSEADYASNAWTLSGEYGKRFALGGAYIEPNAELILGHVGSADYTTSKGMKVNVDASKHAITRLGFNLGKEFTNANAYFKANYYHDFAGGGGITADTVSYERDSFKNWWELGIGGATKLGKNTSAYAEVNKYFGDMKSDVTFNVGLRYSF